MRTLDLLALSLAGMADAIAAYCDEHQDEFNEWKGTVVLDEEQKKIKALDC